jgi:hypothetical protein
MSSENPMSFVTAELKDKIDSQRNKIHKRGLLVKMKICYICDFLFHLKNHLFYCQQ